MCSIRKRRASEYCECVYLKVEKQTCHCIEECKNETVEKQVTHLMVGVEQREETIPVVSVIVYPEISRYIGIRQHPLSF